MNAHTLCVYFHIFIRKSPERINLILAIQPQTYKIDELKKCVEWNISLNGLSQFLNGTSVQDPNKFCIDKDSLVRL